MWIHVFKAPKASCFSSPLLSPLFNFYIWTVTTSSINFELTLLLEGSFSTAFYSCPDYYNILTKLPFSGFLGDIVFGAFKIWVGILLSLKKSLFVQIQNLERLKCRAKHHLIRLLSACEQALKNTSGGLFLLKKFPKCHKKYIKIGDQKLAFFRIFQNFQPQILTD